MELTTKDAEIELTDDGALPNTTHFGWSVCAYQDGGNMGPICTFLFNTRAEAFINLATIADDMAYDRIDVRPMLRAPFEKEQARIAAHNQHVANASEFGLYLVRSASPK